MRIKTLGLALMALLVFGAPSAMAGGWKQHGSELAKAITVVGTGNIEVEEPYHNTRFTCAFHQEGTVGPGVSGEITGKKIYNCTYGSGVCVSGIELEALNLPWKTELATVNGVLRNEIKNGGSGEPRWELRCTTTGKKIEEWCSGAETSTGMSNSKVGVKAVFDNESAEGSCVEGHLRLSGTESVEAVGGEKLGVETPEWLINGESMEKSEWVTSKGTLKLTDPDLAGGSPLSVECASTGENHMGPGGVSELTELKLSGCKFLYNGKEGKCSAKSSIAAIHLPWRMGLLSGSPTRGLIAESGEGAPGFKVECEIIGFSTIKDTCTGNTSAAMSVVTGGVDETFDSHSEKLNCLVSGTGTGVIEGTSLLENPSGKTLTFRE